jgi:uncharacterized coiled-coil protein SlyX
MPKIDPATIDLSKLAVSETGVPIGYRELLPEDTVQNGDIYDSHSGDWGGNFGERWRVQKRAQRLEPGRGFYGPPENGWLKHFRLLDVPFNVPEGYGRVTGGTTKKGDIVADRWGRVVCEPYEADHDYPATSSADVGLYRLQPAFPVAPKAEGPFCYGNLSLRPPGVEMKKQFVFDRDYKSGCDKLQAKVNELTKRLRDSETALGVRTEQLGSAQDHIASESALVFARVTALKARIAELEHKTKHQKDMLDAGHTVIAELMARVAELAQESESWRKTARALQKIDTGVGEGYRELLPDEFPEPGDEFSYIDEYTNARSNWQVRTAPRGVTYGKMLLTAVKGFKYRRKLLVPGPAAAPVDPVDPVDPGVGKGYRELRDAELPTARDEFSFAPFSNVPRIWSYRGWPSTGPNETYGNLKRELGAGLQYRRKVRAF